MIDQYIKEISNGMELAEPLRSDVQGVWAMPIEEDAAVMITALPPHGFALNCGFASCPRDNREQFYEKMLLANLFGQGTKGAVLGLNEEGTLLTLAHTKPQCADYKEFRDILEDFINTVDFWREEAVNWK